MWKQCVGVALTLIMVTRSCDAARAERANLGNPVRVTIRGYHGDAMEPFVSPDGKYLFFNSRNDPGTDTEPLLRSTRQRHDVHVRRSDRRCQQ